MGPVRSNGGIFTALSATGRRNGRWSACLVPRLIVESWQGVSIEPLKRVGSKLGVNKTMSLGGQEEDQGRTQSSDGVSPAAASIPLLLVPQSPSHCDGVTKKAQPDIFIQQFFLKHCTGSLLVGQ